MKKIVAVLMLSTIFTACGSSSKPNCGVFEKIKEVSSQSSGLSSADQAKKLKELSKSVPSWLKESVSYVATVTERASKVDAKDPQVNEKIAAIYNDPKFVISRDRVLGAAYAICQLNISEQVVSDSSSTLPASTVPTTAATATTAAP